MKAAVYNKEGEKKSDISLPDDLFKLPWNNNLVIQVARSIQANMRRPVAHAKDRSEVRGGGRKPWRQKGTGRARHGSIRSPIWAGGGVTHGPLKNRSFAKKINKKMSKKATAVVLSKKLEDGELVFVDDITLKTPNTKKASAILRNLSKVKGFEELNSKKGSSVLLATTNTTENTFKSFKNLENVHMKPANDINVVDLLSYKFVVIEEPNGFIKRFVVQEKSKKEKQGKKESKNKKETQSSIK